jgi:hypothetical protein
VFFGEFRWDREEHDREEARRAWRETRERERLLLDYITFPFFHDLEKPGGEIINQGAIILPKQVDWI